MKILKSLNRIFLLLVFVLFFNVSSFSNESVDIWSLDNNTKDLSKPLLKKDDFVTENLADIYIKQDKIDDAIKIYKKLILINSKKKSYFAKKINDLKK